MAFQPRAEMGGDEVIDAAKATQRFHARMRGESTALLDMYADLRADVCRILEKESAFSLAAIEGACRTLFDMLGLPKQYFEEHDAQDISKHVATLLG
jgi:hypothetical protein